ncbi:PREDICTED: probably inactive leucine-rich repeat receptor-like protein kinase At2g25790 [Nelumbo nucifera]|uniref:Probably inactive leucine-rich repeat receptor-like protein kinase At2g25790 n=1 Tax=Nelumbo nucifera TaxID=4432 RepID=A0A1U7ZKS4_NELNU|nr:PREDICTED: probably inactive leucine-rich repeat receptor-like protein kinase At2g25790 [Nelumbo nucifera]
MLHHLSDIHLSSCELAELPPLDGLPSANFTSLSVLDLSWNDYFNSTLPDWLYSLHSLTYLDLSFNSFRGTVSYSIANLTSLHELYLHYNGLEKEIPKSVGVGHLCNLEILFLPNNRYSVAKYPDFWELISMHQGQSGVTTSGMESIEWHDSRKHWTCLWKLELLGISDNSFHGVLSELHYANLTRLKVLKAPSNSLVLNFLDLSNNLLSGNIPDCWMNWPSPRVIKLVSNKLTGNLPISLGSLIGLQPLHLRNNSLTGELPSSLRIYTELTTIDISGNELSGRIPIWVGLNLERLIVLGLRSNKFSGSILQNFVISLIFKYWTLQITIDQEPYQGVSATLVLWHQIRSQFTILVMSLVKM